ncbi:MAG: rod shape-determining protein MreC [Coriobacteriia bacterium]|nr:rod shape-determining protein MreC [Coriobacteriia bacterium]
MNTLGDDIKALLMKPIVTVIILMLISLGICGIYSNEGENGIFHRIQKAAVTFVMPFSAAGHAVSDGLTTVSDYIFNNTTDEDTLKGLQKENAKLKTQLISAEKYKDEAIRLQKLLDLKDQYKAEGVCAHVVASSTSAYNQTITISAGENKEIHAGQTVLGVNGVVGQVISTTPSNATIRLLSDPNSGVAVKVLGAKSDCILRGSLDGVLYLEGLDINANISVGDSVVTSGLGGSYVEGLVIGSVSQIIQSTSGSNRRVIVSPIEQTGSLSEVLVIKESE